MPEEDLCRYDIGQHRRYHDSSVQAISPMKIVTGVTARERNLPKSLNKLLENSSPWNEEVLFAIEIVGPELPVPGCLSGRTTGSRSLSFLNCMYDIALVLGYRGVNATKG